MRDLFECTRTITLPQTPTAVLDKFGLMDITFSGYRYAKSLSDCGDEMVASLTPVK